MDRETQEIIGRALYEACADFTDMRTPQWHQLLAKDMWIVRASAVVEAYEKHKKEKRTN